MHIKTHTQRHTATAHEFYILSKGRNSGRPMATPCPNCFVCVCCSMEEREFYYWLLFALWQAKYWHQFLTGSVIEFLRLPDLREQLQKHQQTATKPGFSAAVKKAGEMAALEKSLLKQLQLVREMRVAILRQHLQ